TPYIYPLSLHDALPIFLSNSFFSIISIVLDSMTRENKFCSIPSAITSLNQNAIEETTVMNPIINKYPPFEKPCIDNTPDVVKVRSEEHTSELQSRENLV